MAVECFALRLRVLCFGCISVYSDLVGFWGDLLWLFNAVRFWVYCGCYSEFWFGMTGVCLLLIVLVVVTCLRLVFCL